MTKDDDTQVQADTLLIVYQSGFADGKQAAQPEPVSMRMPKVGDKVICLEDESLGEVVSLTAGGSPDIAFDDGSLGTYLLREFAELFGYVTPPAAQPEQEPVAWVYPEGLEALKAGKPWTAYGKRQEPNNTALYLSPQPDIAPYAWVTFTPYGDEDDVWYENPEGQLSEGWTYKPLYDTTPPQRQWVGLTDEDVNRESSVIDARLKLAFHSGMYVAQKILKEKNNG